MAKILVLPSEVVGELESGNSYAFPYDNILMSDMVTTIEDAINDKPGEKISSSGSSASGEIFNDYENNIANSLYSHAEGQATTAGAVASHAEGQNTQAMGSGSHAEGQTTTASGMCSHAEGGNTTASAVRSHAEGYHTIASGDNSHSEGVYTEAASDAQHVQGQYNIVDSEDKYAHIVGWGTSTSDRANIHTIDTNGNGWFSGKVSAGTESSPATPTADNDLTTKKYV